MGNISENCVSVAGHELYYKEAGKGDVLLLIHGIPTHSGLWRHIIPKLAKKHRVIAPDLLNYGRSEKPEKANVSIKAQCDLLMKLMDELHVNRFDVAGHDIGGGVAQLMAVNYPDRIDKLVLIDSVCFDSWPIPEFEPMQKDDAEEQTSVEQLKRQMKELMPKGVYNKEVMSDELMQLYLRVWDSEKGKTAFFRNVRYLDPKYTKTIEKDLEELPHPTLIIWGKEDEFQKRSYGSLLKDAIPNAEFQLIKEAGHWVLEEKPEEVYELMDAFLEKGKGEQQRAA